MAAPEVKFINFTSNIFPVTNGSVSAVKSIRIPSTISTPSILYPGLPSIVLKTSVVKSSTKSTSFFDLVPNSCNFKFGSNSIIGRLALAN